MRAARISLMFVMSWAVSQVSANAAEGPQRRYGLKVDMDMKVGAPDQATPTKITGDARFVYALKASPGIVEVSVEEFSLFSRDGSGATTNFRINHQGYSDERGGVAKAITRDNASGTALEALDTF